MWSPSYMDANHASNRYWHLTNSLKHQPLIGISLPSLGNIKSRLENGNVYVEAAFFLNLRARQFVYGLGLRGGEENDAYQHIIGLIGNTIFPDPNPLSRCQLFRRLKGNYRGSVLWVSIRSEGALFQNRRLGTRGVNQLIYVQDSLQSTWHVNEQLLAVFFSIGMRIFLW